MPTVHGKPAKRFFHRRERRWFLPGLDQAPTKSVSIGNSVEQRRLGRWWQDHTNSGGSSFEIGRCGGPVWSSCDGFFEHAEGVRPRIVTIESWLTGGNWSGWTSWLDLKRKTDGATECHNFRTEPDPDPVFSHFGPATKVHQEHLVEEGKSDFNPQNDSDYEFR